MNCFPAYKQGDYIGANGHGGEGGRVAMCGMVIALYGSKASEKAATVPGLGGFYTELGIQRLVQAGGKPISWVQLICEFQRDWNREETVPGFADILFAVAGH